MRTNYPPVSPTLLWTYNVLLRPYNWFIVWKEQRADGDVFEVYRMISDKTGLDLVFNPEYTYICLCVGTWETVIWYFDHQQIFFLLHGKEIEIAVIEQPRSAMPNEVISRLWRQYKDQRNYWQRIIRFQKGQSSEDSVRNAGS